MIICGTDIETTGLIIGEDRIVEFYGSHWDSDSETFIKELHLRINPERSMRAEAQRVHGITLADVMGCPTWADVAEKISTFLNEANIVVAHNGASFDKPFLDFELHRASVPIIAASLADTMIDGKWATPNGKSPSLQELCFACDVSYDATLAHAARYDVERMMECFFLGRKWGFYNND